MDVLNLKNLSSTIITQLPHYLANDDDYTKFVKFMQLYYEYLSVGGNPTDVATRMADYGDLDKTLDTFVDEFKYEIASVFPSITRIKEIQDDNAEMQALFNATGVTNADTVKYQTDTYTGNGVVSEFLLSYFAPSYYFGRDVALRVTDLKVYSNPTLFESSMDTYRASNPLAGLTFPADYSLLTEGTDYVITGQRIKFYNNDTLTAPSDQVSIKVVYQLNLDLGATASQIQTQTKKARYSNKKHFYKLLKDFYQSKGSVQSFKFIFRAFFNEDIEIYYPKENILKTNENTWAQSVSLRTRGIVDSLNPPGKTTEITALVGETSGATAIPESNYHAIQDSIAFTEYVVTNISGTFQSQEFLLVHVEDTNSRGEVENRIIRAQLFDVITGFDITNPGTNYPRNVFIQNYESNGGSGVGMKGRIEGTTDGEISSVEVVNGGTNYITGELIEFNDTGTGGSGALARVAEVTNTEQKYDITWVQDITDALYPKTQFEVSDANSTYGHAVQYSESLSRDTKVTIKNHDPKFDDVVALFDFENLVPGTLQFQEYKNDLENSRQNATRDNPNIGPKIGNFSLRVNDNGYVRIPNLPSLLTGSTDFTVDFWYHGSGFAGDTGDGAAVFAINGTEAGSHDNQLVLFHRSDGKFTVAVDDTNKTSTGLLTDTATTDDWNHVALYYNTSSGVKVYQNGELKEDIFGIGQFGGTIDGIQTSSHFTIGADFDKSLDATDDGNNAYYSSFRVTKGQRFTEYVDATDGNKTKILYSDLNPIPNEEELQPWQYEIANNRLTLKEYNAQGFLATRTLPDWFSVNLYFRNLPIGSISRVNLISGGSGYVRNPIARVADESEGYTSLGNGASFNVITTNIGGISRIKIVQSSTNPTAHGFGIGYGTVPTLDLSTLGDGNAVVTPIKGILCEREGRFLNDQGFLSDNNRIHDGYLWQDYSYVVRVNRIVNEWRDIIKKVVHPLGMALFGELVLLTKVEGKQLKRSILYIFYEIIKNLDIKSKNMDGLGVWTYPNSGDSQIDTKQLLSHGYSITYDNRQDDAASLTGADDDTPAGQNVDVGEGRYALQKSDNTTATSWSDVATVSVNNKDKFYTDYRFFYEDSEDMIGREFVIYNMSDAFITSAEHTITRPYARYRVTQVQNVDTDNDGISNISKFTVTLVSSVGDLPPTTPDDVIEFRWDRVFRGNVERNPSYWVGSTRDGADPSDDKYVIKIGSRRVPTDYIPSMGTTYKSLERFKFFFDEAYPFDRLVRYRMSPEGEVAASPYNQMFAPNGTFNTMKMLPTTTKFITIRNPNGKNEYAIVPAYLDTEVLSLTGRPDGGFVGVTDGTDHEWGTTTIKRVQDLFDRDYHAVLDSHVNIGPKVLVITEESREQNGQTVNGLTNLSVERRKFNDTSPQGLDNDLYNYKIETINQYTERSNIAQESAIRRYMKQGEDATSIASAYPTSISEWESIPELFSPS